jgi:hypothetical protein
MPRLPSVEPAERERAPRLRPSQSEPTRTDGWFFGGCGDYFPELTWENRPPDMARSQAPEVLQDAWTAVVMAVQQAHGGLRRGSCYWLNLAGAPLAQMVLGEPVNLCAGFAAFFERRTKIQTGFRWRPPKWVGWIDRDAGSHVAPTEDVHCWLETATHLIDFDGGVGAPDDVWPPLIYRPKTTLLKHPRDAQGAGDILLWRSIEARELVGKQIVPLALPIAARAAALFEIFTQGTLAERRDATMQHEMILSLARCIAPERGNQLTARRGDELLPPPI